MPEKNEGKSKESEEQMMREKETEEQTVNEKVV